MIALNRGWSGGMGRPSTSAGMSPRFRASTIPLFRGWAPTTVGVTSSPYQFLQLVQEGCIADSRAMIPASPVANTISTIHRIRVPVAPMGDPSEPGLPMLVPRDRRNFTKPWAAARPPTGSGGSCSSRSSTVIGAAMRIAASCPLSSSSWRPSPQA